MLKAFWFSLLLLAWNLDFSPSLPQRKQSFISAVYKEICPLTWVENTMIEQRQTSFVFKFFVFSYIYSFVFLSDNLCGEYDHRAEVDVFRILVCLYFHMSILLYFCLLTCVENTMKEQMQPRRPKNATTARRQSRKYIHAKTCVKQYISQENYEKGNIFPGYTLLVGSHNHMLHE